MEFKRGDDVQHFFELPIASYQAGGTLTFIAKPVVDNDSSNTAAVIQRDFDDTAADVSTTAAIWTLDFPPADTLGIVYEDGASSRQFLGEFQYTQSNGQIKSFPGNNDFIEVVVFGDIKVEAP